MPPSEEAVDLGIEVDLYKNEFHINLIIKIPVRDAYLLQNLVRKANRAGFQKPNIIITNFICYNDQVGSQHDLFGLHSGVPIGELSLLLFFLCL